MLSFRTNAISKSANGMGQIVHLVSTHGLIAQQLQQNAGNISKMVFAMSSVTILVVSSMDVTV